MDLSRLHACGLVGTLKCPKCERGKLKLCTLKCAEVKIMEVARLSFNLWRLAFKVSVVRICETFPIGERFDLLRIIHRVLGWTTRLNKSKGSHKGVETPNNTAKAISRASYIINDGRLYAHAGGRSIQKLRFLN